jgi:hypothetical protein
MSRKKSVPISPKKISSTKVKTVILAIVIAIVLAFFVGYLIEAIYHSPKYEDYCGKIITPMEEKYGNMTQSICEDYGGEWTPQNIECIKAPCPQGYCDFYFKCQEEFQKAQDKYNLVVFIVAVIVGLIAVTFGIILQLASVSSGLMLGGGFLTLYGTMRYWYNLSNWIRVILLGIALLILIWLGYRKLQN